MVVMVVVVVWVVAVAAVVLVVVVAGCRIHDGSACRTCGGPRPVPGRPDPCRASPQPFQGSTCFVKLAGNVKSDPDSNPIPERALRRSPLLMPIAIAYRC